MSASSNDAADINAATSRQIHEELGVMVRIFPFAGDGKWYWQDAECDEPMGPFDSYREAWKDYKACRK